MQAQIQVLLIAAGGGVTGGSNTGPNMEVTKLLVFSREEKVEGFIMAFRLFLKMKMREVMVEEQIQWVLSYIQGELADVWKENILEDLVSARVEFESAGEFLLELKKKFKRGDEKSVKVAELRRIKQEGKTMKEFVQEFHRVARDSEYNKRTLIEEFKKGMNKTIRRKLMEAERSPMSIE